MKKTIVLFVALTLSLLAATTLAQGENIIIQPGQSVTIECAECPECEQGWTPARYYPWGLQSWGYNWEAMLTYSHPGCIMSIPNLWQFGPDPSQADWPSLLAALDLMNAACPNVGLVDSNYARLTGKATNVMNHGGEFGFIAYGPEGLQGVPPEEVDPELMPGYAQQLVDFATANGKRVVYGPATESLSLEWQWGVTYTLDAELIVELASLLPDDSVWFVRPFQFQSIYHDDPDGFRAAVEELVGYIHEGNPTLVTWAQLFLSPTVDELGMDFLSSRQTLVGVVDATHMELIGPNEPGYWDETLAAMQVVWDATGE